MLKRSFQERCGKNAHYSLRAFSRDLEISVAGLSNILNQKRGLSYDRAIDLTQHLEYSPIDSELFCQSVLAAHGKSKQVRDQASSRVQELQLKSQKFEIDEMQFAMLGHWYTHAVLQYIDDERAGSELKWLSQRLGVNEIIIQSSLETLERLGLIYLDNARWRKTHQVTETKSEIPSKVLREVSKDFLDKAKEALDTQTIAERSFATSLLLLDKQQFEIIKDQINRLREDLTSETSSQGDNQDLYCFSTQLFRLSQKDSTGRTM
jgi:uncharacterized protein (TIGR02147 family)